MLTHLFRLIWNKKKQNFLLLLEIFIAFIGLCAGFTFILYPYNNYKIPNGFEHENIWTVTPNKPMEITNTDSLQIFRESVKKVLLSLNGVEDVTYSSVNFPFSGNGFSGGINYNGVEAWGYFYTVEDNYEDILKMKVLEGRWFSNDDKVSNYRPAVINEKLKKELFKNENVLGKIVESDVAAERMKIVGVVADTKDESEFEEPRPAIFRQMDTSDMDHPYSILIKVNPGADAALESKIYKILSNTMKNANIEVEHLTDLKNVKNRAMRVPLIIFLVIAGFLVINVGLGIFGVLWYNINKRRGEIGLRMAVGATGNSISKQLVTEAVLLATLSVMLGSLFAIQFPLLNLLQLPAYNYVIAIILSVVFIYALVVICAVYPGRQAASIYPAVALHED